MEKTMVAKVISELKSVYTLKTLQKLVYGFILKNTFQDNIFHSVGCFNYRYCMHYDIFGSFSFPES